MRRPLAATLVTLAAGCTAGDRASSGECPPSEVCSDATPDGLFFVGPSMAGFLFDGGPQVVAINGTQELRIQYPGGAAFDLPYRAESSHALSVERTQGAVVTLRGANDGGEYLRIVDPTDDTLYDRINVRAANLENITLVSGTFEITEPATPVAFAVGTRQVGVALHAAFDRLVDQSMLIEAAGSERIAWDTIRLPAGATGTLPLTVTAAADAPVTLAVELVTGADSVTRLPSLANVSYVEDELSQVCFGAFTGPRQILGLAWTFTLDGAALTGGIAPNCAQFTAAVAGTYTVVATAGGHAATAVVTVDAAAGDKRAPHRDARAGERASATD